MTDASRDRLLQDNLAALRGSVGTLPDLTIDSRRLRLENTPTGPSASVESSNGHWVRLHSGRDPVLEAERLVTRFLRSTRPPLIVLIGAGLGYTLDAIERQSPSTRVLVVEPLPDVAAAMLARRGWQEWATTERLRLLVGPEYAGASDAWRFIGADGASPPVMLSPVWEREFPVETARAVEVADQTLFGARANAEARRTFAPRYLLNTIANMPAIAGASDVEALRNAFPGVPGIVVAAGPSIDKHLGTLRQARDQAVIIAVDTAVRPLLDAGIHPHLAVAVDPSEANGRHLRDLPETDHTFLVAEGSLDPAALAAFDGRTFIFSVSDHHPWPWLRSHGLGRGHLRAWGSVLTSAFDLALEAGCSPIVFAGADLAYPDHRPYCRGTTFEEDWAERVAAGESLMTIWRTELEARGAITVDGREGRPVWTAPHLLAVRDWLVEQIETHGTTRFINATGDGILDGRGLEHLPLPDVLASMPVGAWRGENAVRAAWSRGRSRNAEGRPTLRRLLALLSSGRAQEPLTSWLEFARSGVSRNAVIDTLRTALAERPLRRRLVPDQELRATVRYAPERVALIRSAIVGEDSDLVETMASARVVGPVVPLPHETIARVDRQLAALLRAPGPLVTDDRPGEGGIPFGTPASRALPWNEQSRGLVLAYEAALADHLFSRLWHKTSRCQFATDRVDLRLLSTAPTLGPTAPKATPQMFRDMCARLAVVADWLSALAWCERHDGVGATGMVVEAFPLSVAAAVVRAYSEMPPASTSGGTAAHPVIVGMDQDQTVLLMAETGALRRRMADALSETLAARCDHAREDTPVPAVWPALAISLPGGTSGTQLQFTCAAASPTGSRPSKQSSDCRVLSWVMPVRLTGPALPPCMVGNALDNDHAAFAAVGGLEAILIDAHGRWERDAAWPRPISGWVRWGPRGAIAWHTEPTSYVMWRDHVNGPVHRDVIPFHVCLAFPQEDGSIWWTTFNGGLWSWTPGDHWRQLVHTPPTMAVQRTGSTVRLDPAGSDPRLRDRRPLREGFAWNPDSGTVEPIPLDAAGPCWSRASSGGWTAAAHPQSDCVLLSHRRQPSRALTCAYPFNVAWAGPSLLVSSGRGALLLFRDLLSHLDH